jgi:hypothetical protein
MATRVERLTNTRASLLRIIDEQTEAWVTAGCPPTFSLDGESYQWDSWLTSKLDAVEKLDGLIQRAQPYYKRSRHRG